jgi:hypothetical protein
VNFFNRMHFFINHAKATTYTAVQFDKLPSMVME